MIDSGRRDLLELAKQRNTTIDALLLIKLSPYNPEDLAKEEKEKAVADAVAATTV